MVLDKILYEDMSNYIHKATLLLTHANFNATAHKAGIVMSEFARAVIMDMKWRLVITNGYLGVMAYVFKCTQQCHPYVAS